MRWPLLHSEELAGLHALALERGPLRFSEIGAAIEGFAVGRIASAFARRSVLRISRRQSFSEAAIAAELARLP